MRQALTGPKPDVAERLIAEHLGLGLGLGLHLLQVDNGLASEETIKAIQMVAEEVVPLVLREDRRPKKSFRSYYVRPQAEEVVALVLRETSGPLRAAEVNVLS
jgi:hypothetical protein